MGSQQRSPRGRRALLGALAAASFCCPAASAQDLPRFEFEQAPTSVAIPSDSALDYRLVILGGTQPARLRINVRASTRFGEEHDRPEGFPIGLAGPLTVEGDATDEGASGGTGVVSCSPSGGLPHGMDGSGESIDLWIPAESRSVLKSRFTVASTPPWPKTDYRPRFTIGSFRSDDPAVTAMRPNGVEVPEQVLLPPPMTITGLRGTRIALHTAPATADRAGGETPSIAVGGVLRISGSTDPPRPHGTLVLRYIGPGTDRALRDVAAVALDAEGRYQYAGWQPAAPGYHELWAFIGGLEGHFAPDHFCPRAFAISGSETPAQLPGLELALATRRVRPVGRRVKLTFACSGPVGDACRAKVGTYVSRRYKPMQRRIVVASGATTTANVLLPRRLRRAPAAITVTVTPTDGPVTKVRVKLR